VRTTILVAIAELSDFATRKHQRNGFKNRIIGACRQLQHIAKSMYIVWARDEAVSTFPPYAFRVHTHFGREQHETCGSRYVLRKKQMAFRGAFHTKIPI
jgi:hypothetical protein